MALALFVGVVSQFVPVVGTYIANGFPALIALSVDPVKALWVIVFAIVFQQIENYFMAPRITARTMSLHPGGGLRVRAGRGWACSGRSAP